MTTISNLFFYLENFEELLWAYLCVPVLIVIGIYLTVQSRFIQIRKFPATVKTFFKLITNKEENARGIHPLQAFFASVGGCVGLGNIAAVCTAIQIGGPGALLWIWITAFFGMIIKYSEIFLGIRYRVANNSGGYNGGPMYYLPHAFKWAWLPSLVCMLLCVYGVEVYQFSLVTDSIVTNLGINRYVVIGIFVSLVLFAGNGGVKRVGMLSSVMIPLFVVIYLGMGFWVLLNNLSVIPAVISHIFSSAFTGAAAVGGFAGSTLMLMVSHGVRRGCYTGDLGVGYASIIHSESSVTVPEKQASLAIFDIFIDTFLICTMSILIILVSGVWQEPIDASMMVQTALGHYFSHMNLFMPFFIFLLGYSTINAYFCVGIKCADYLSPKYGRLIYNAYAIAALVTFSFIGTTQAQTVMTIVNGLLLVINVWGIFRLRSQISYGVEEESVPQLSTNQNV